MERRILGFIKNQPNEMGCVTASPEMRKAESLLREY